MSDITCLVDKMRGQEYIDTLRRIHAETRERGGFVRCSGESCTKPAMWIGMQTCGAAGGPICEVHKQRHEEWMAASAKLGQPYCRHCKQDVDAASHIYVVSIEGPTK